MFTDVSEQLVAIFFMVWVQEETIKTVEFEAKAPKQKSVTTYHLTKV